MLKSPHVRKSGFRSLRNFSRGIQNPGKILLVESAILGFGIRLKLKESRIPLETGIQNPSSTDKDWDPLPGIPNPRHTMQNPRLYILNSLTWGDRKLPDGAESFVSPVHKLLLDIHIY